MNSAVNQMSSITPEQIHVLVAEHPDNFTLTQVEEALDGDNCETLRAMCIYLAALLQVTDGELQACLARSPRPTKGGTTPQA